MFCVYHCNTRMIAHKDEVRKKVSKVEQMSKTIIFTMLITGSGVNQPCLVEIIEL